MRPCDWFVDESGLAQVRRMVFIEEQGVPEAMEWEPIDPQCNWFAAWHEGVAVGIARLTPQGRLGRMAVLKAWRGLGIGSRLLEMALNAAREQQMVKLELHAQCHALTFYQRFGFVVVGPEFDEAGIPHRQMILNLRSE